MYACNRPCLLCSGYIDSNFKQEPTADIAGYTCSPRNRDQTVSCCNYSPKLNLDAAWCSSWLGWLQSNCEDAPCHLQLQKEGHLREGMVASLSTCVFAKVPCHACNWLLLVQQQDCWVQAHRPVCK